MNAGTLSKTTLAALLSVILSAPAMAQREMGEGSLQIKSEGAAGAPRILPLKHTEVLARLGQPILQHCDLGPGFIEIPIGEAMDPRSEGNILVMPTFITQQFRAVIDQHVEGCVTWGLLPDPDQEIGRAASSIEEPQGNEAP